MTKSKRHKLRIVYAKDQDGNPSYSIFVDHKEAIRIFEIYDTINKYTKLSNRTMLKELNKKNLNVGMAQLYMTLNKLYGAIWIDMKVGDEYEKVLTGRLLPLQDEHHPKQNLPKVPKFLKGSRYTILART